MKDSNIYIILLIILSISFLFIIRRALVYRNDFYNCENKYEKLRDDWEGRKVYDKKVINKRSDAVFIGASEIEKWELDKFFPQYYFINRGIGEQISAQMLLRFYQDVINISPRIVVITAGANDIKNKVPFEYTKEYIKRMCDLAKNNNIEIILTTITPVNDTQRGMLKLRPPDKIKELNNWIKIFSENENYRVADFYSDLADKNGMLPENYSTDGVHLNEIGYKIISKTIDKIIKEMDNLR